MKYHIITYGCQMNKNDSERIAAVLESINYQSVSKIQEADLIIVNMCSIRQSAVDRVYGLLPKFKKLKIKNKNLKTILTGCILEQDRKKFVKYFDYILNIKNLPNWHHYLTKPSSRSLISQKTIFQKLPWQKLEDSSYLEIKPKYSNNFSAFVPISIGCNNFCSFCVVPYTRGREFHRPANKIINEIKDLIKKGYKEIWLLGENVNSYRSRLIQTSTRKNSEINFAKLLKIVNDISGNFWIRFTSPNPKNFSDKLIEVIAKCKKITPYLNLPVQSGDNNVLKKMNRNYTIEEYKDLVKTIRNKFALIRKGLEKEITISTDVIVGFPGETKKQFENTVKLFKEIKFDMAYIAKYSSRAGTTAGKMKDNVPYQEKKRREKVLTEILKQTALENNKKYIGKTIDVLVEKEINGFLIGKTITYKTIKLQVTSLPEIQSDGYGQTSYKLQDLIGKFVKAKVVDALSWGLKGTV